MWAGQALVVPCSMLLQSGNVRIASGDEHPLVFPIIGSRDYIDQRGFFINECPTCRKASVFAVYDTKRKLTLYFVPTMNVRSQMVMECMTCHGKWGISGKQIAFVESNLMSQLELSAYLGRQQDSRPDPPRIQQAIGRTYYQVLQVDPFADPEVIDAAFKRLAMKHHPDTSSDPLAAGRMRDLLTAREILTDPARRAAYDKWLGIVHRVEAIRPEEV
jgi:hypothetical protein